MTCTEYVREAVEGIQEQGVDEAVSYTLNTTQWGGAPTGVSVDVFAGIAHNDDVSTVVMPTGTPAVTSNTITLPPLANLVRGELYRVRVSFNIGGAARSAWFDVLAML